MKIDNFIRIIDGTLQTSPSIDAFERVVFESGRTLRGDAFIDLHASRQAIQEAITKGAYAIVSTHAFEGTDDEIAWIHVSSIDQMLIRLLRYTITQKSLHLVDASTLHAAWLDAIQTSPKNIKRLKGTLSEHAIELLRAKENEWFCLSDSALCERIAPLALRIEKPLHVKPFVAKGLFLSSFWHQERYWVEHKIPPLFMAEFEALLSFCDAHHIAYSLENLAFTEHFYPQFVTPRLRKKEFGSSDKVLIFETSPHLLKTEILYLEHVLNPKHLCVCLPKGYITSFTCNAMMLHYETPEEIHLLRDMPFQCALVLGNKEAFEPLLTQTFTHQPTLF